MRAAACVLVATCALLGPVSAQRDLGEALARVAQLESELELAKMHVQALAFGDAPAYYPDEYIPDDLIPESDNSHYMSFAASPAMELIAMATNADRARVANLARTKVGSTYVYGAAGPSQFDCSGLVQWSWRNAAGVSLPRTASQQYAAVQKISLSSAVPGDLVFYFKNGVSHVGIFIGNGQMVHAANSRKGIRVDAVLGPWYNEHFTGAGRVP